MALHSIAHSAGALTVALGVPDSHACHVDSHLNFQRRELNSLLDQWSSSEPRTLFVSTDALVPYESTSGHLWCDGLHMSREGYRQLGQKLGGLEALRGHLMKAVANQNER